MPRCSAPSPAAHRASCRWRWPHPRIRQKESTVIKKSVTIELETNGEQEEQAMDALVALMNDKFGEGE